MNRKQLRQYRDLKREIEHLEHRKNQLRQKRKVVDKVQASSREHPYNFMEVNNVGYKDMTTVERKTLDLLQKRKKRARQEMLEIDTFISSIDDSQVRLIFDLRYTQGKSWIYISRQFGAAHESYARKIHDRYLDKMDSD